MSAVRHRRLQVGLLGLALAAAPWVAEGSRGAVLRHDKVLKRESELVLVPAGAFIQGADKRELADFDAACRAEFGEEIADQACRDDRTRDFATDQPRLVYLSSFEIDRFEVTTREYRECVARGPCDMRPLVAGDGRYAVDAWPMVNVTWDDAATYCAWRGKRLPSEAEWEKAARGPDGRRWPWGDLDRDEGGNRGLVEPEFQRGPSPFDVGTTIDDRDGFPELAPPGSLPFGKSPYGVHDLAGNASEWVADWYDEKGYASQSTVDPRGPIAGHNKVTRGGSFYEPRFFARAYYRNAELPSERSVTRGFRCARDVR